MKSKKTKTESKQKSRQQNLHCMVQPGIEPQCRPDPSLSARHPNSVYCLSPLSRGEDLCKTQAGLCQIQRH